MKKLVLLTLPVLLFGCTVENEQKDPLKLWYDEPADEWVEALPVGNGRLGGMIYGGTVNERIQVNEETLWTGQPHDYVHKGAHAYLDTLRQLLWDGKQNKAHELGNEKFMSQPFGQFSYQPFCDIMITFPEFKQNWHRLKENEEDEILDVMGALLTPETKAAILADLDAPVEAAKEAWRQEHSRKSCQACVRSLLIRPTGAACIAADRTTCWNSTP